MNDRRKEDNSMLAAVQTVCGSSDSWLTGTLITSEFALCRMWTKPQSGAESHWHLLRVPGTIPNPANSDGGNRQKSSFVAFPCTLAGPLLTADSSRVGKRMGDLKIDK